MVGQEICRQKILFLGRRVPDPFYESFKFLLPGYNVRPTEISGALGIEQLKKLDKLVHGRRKNASKFVSLFGSIPIYKSNKKLAGPAGLDFRLLSKESSLTLEILRRKLDELGFEYRPIVAGNFIHNPVMRFFDYEISGELLNAEIVDKQGLFIGNHHYDIGWAIQALYEHCMEV